MEREWWCEWWWWWCCEWWSLLFQSAHILVLAKLYKITSNAGTRNEIWIRMKVCITKRSHLEEIVATTEETSKSKFWISVDFGGSPYRDFHPVPTLFPGIHLLNTNWFPNGEWLVRTPSPVGRSVTCTQVAAAHLSLTLMTTTSPLRRRARGENGRLDWKKRLQRETNHWTRLIAAEQKPEKVSCGSGSVRTLGSVRPDDHIVFSIFGQFLQWKFAQKHKNCTKVSWKLCPKPNKP